MKIRIAEQIFDIDEKTLGDWIRLGRVPPDAFLLIETPARAEWTSVRELEPVRRFWSSEDAASGGAASPPAQEELQTERRFFAYQRRRPAVTWVFILVNVFLFLMIDHLVGRAQSAQVLIQAGAYYYPLIMEGQYWRLITSVFLHGNQLHLALNMLLLFVTGNLIEGLYGRRRFLILYLVSAIGGGLASLPFVQEAPGVGASGAIFGLMGAIIALGLRYKDRIPRRRGRIFGLYLLPFIIMDFFIGVVVIPAFRDAFGLNIPSINNAAHLGGLIAGFVTAMVMAPDVYADREPKAITVLAAALATLTIISGVIPVASSIDNAQETRENAARPRFALPSPEDLPGYISRYEEEIEKRRYDLQTYQILEALYIEALRSDLDNPVWVEKLKRFYEKALLEDVDNRAWASNLLRLYINTASEKPEEKTALEGYIQLCERVEARRGYHQPLYEAAQFFYVRAKELQPENSAWTQKLKSFYEKALEADAGNPLWNSGLYQLYFETVSNGESSAEKQALREYIELCERIERKRGYHPALYGNLQSFYTRAQELALEGDWTTKIEELYKKALRKDPKNPTWNNNLAWRYVEQQTNSNKAVELALNAVREKPAEETFLDTLAWAYLRDGRREQSLRTFEQIFSQPVENEDDRKARESSWKGVTELIHATQSGPTSEAFERTFLKFYERMSRALAGNAEDRARLEAVYDLFQTYHKEQIRRG